MNPLPINPSTPFHAGERAIQEQLGVAERMAMFGSKVVRDFMPDQHRQFYAQLPFVVLATVDAQGNPWASLIEGEPGFASSPEPTLLALHSAPAEHDPARSGWRAGAAIGLLGIELHTRRRNRVNGLLQSGPAGLQLEVEHAFGNCPQYIQARSLHFAHPPGAQPTGPISRGEALDSIASGMIRAAETFFVASYVDHASGKRSVDASHRAGKAGFVRVEGNRLSIPDFAGNLHFNTLGNFVLNPRAGLMFVDFSSGDVLQVVGRVELDFDAEETRFFQGAERLWHVDVERWVLRRGALALRGDIGQMSMNSALTGSWAETQSRLQAERLRDQWRPFRVTRIERESTTIKSFWLEPADGEGLGLFEAGQHLPVRATLPTSQGTVERTYTLSVAPSDGVYRLSIRKQGLYSGFMSDQVRVGDLVETRAPRGNFTVDAREARPLVLISAGVGITPMLAMLRHVVYEGIRKRRIRPTWFIHGSRNEHERGFFAEVAQLAESARGAVNVVQVLKEPGAGLREGADFHAVGRVDLKLLKSVLPFDDFDFYLCGPQAFMQDIYTGLRSMRVPNDRIFAESFGPAGLLRDDSPTTEAVSSEPVPVFFATSGKEARWSPGTGSLLELAESRGVNPAFSCRQGMCGSCSHTLSSGTVTYPTLPSSAINPGQVLLCQAVPAQGSGPVILDV